MREGAQSAPSPPAEPSTHGITCTPCGPSRAQGIAHSIESGFRTLAATDKFCRLLQCAQSTRNSARASKKPEEQVEALAFRAAQ